MQYKIKLKNKMNMINRFYILLSVTAIIFGWLAVGNFNPYFNAFVIGIVFVVYLLCTAYLTDNANEKEAKFLEKLVNFITEPQEDED